MDHRSATQCLFLLQKLSGLTALKQVHAHMIKTAIDQNTYLLSKLVEFAALSSTPRSFGYAREVFYRIQEPNLFLYNTLIRGSLINSLAEEAIFLYLRMRGENLLPNNFTYPFVLRACEDQLELRRGKEVHGCIIRTGFGSDPYVLTTLLNMYSVCEGSMRAATKVFDEMPVRDVVSWNSVIAGYLRHGDLVSAATYFDHAPEKSLVSWNSMVSGYANLGRIKEAKRLFMEMPMKDAASWNSLISGYIKVGDMVSAERIFEQMQEKDVVSWTAMIDGYLKYGLYDRSLTLFRQMQLVKIRPTEVTLLSVLTACANLGALETGSWIHGYINKNGIEIDNNLGTALIDMYAKCGNMEKALDVFINMGRKKDVITWTAMIVGLAMNGRCRESLEFFSNMVTERVRPDEVTFLGVLCACSHAGLIEEGTHYFESMSKDYSLVPKIEHYGCMVDLLGRAGLLEKAEEFVKTMPIKPDSVIWGSLFSASQVHKNVDVGERAMKYLLKMDPENIGNYVTLSNIYACTGRWDDVAEVRKKLVEMGIKRTPGCSSIEVNHQVHEFVSGDTSHSRSTEIYEMLDLLAQRMKVVVHVPNDKY
ncbi:pentatricopeptide repeat-containing protein At1g08070, chloroplastic-like [Macadamia integrifolia]|uniref:pentatricopeptide repeat-containing protein At1g08070, chloroplastic-like n=1 Tax=Macadamia integrifolia TaxID=60698 RepID=UPI001C4F734E|nr:pentatricopeptide repeat-containing protein At1g08070, chloroplastic-like [Macadamia integrifolia]